MPFHLRKPSRDAIQRFLASAQGQALTYEPVGLATSPTAEFRADEASVCLGHGHAAFGRARGALERWCQFDLGWVELFPRDAPIAIGTVVAVLARHLGMYSLNACRVVSTRVTEHEFSFAYGTLADHAESGEEIFRVALEPSSGEVRYEIRVASRARAPLARLGGPVTRAFQAKFRRDSTATMRRVVAG